MKTIAFLLLAALLASGCTAKQPDAQAGANTTAAMSSNSAGCTTTRDANNNVSTVCP
jgi:outer membrane lipoprotein-sorting protein